ncbi:hypothetical protein ACN4EK_01590 [Pantanalinema rosaneae CENA516]|uniref:hypothetical protein n=1 Tax=Pantanalinema rosaneae TaxID=1620701 RepID=UPI003D6FFDE1
MEGNLAIGSEWRSPDSQTDSDVKLNDQREKLFSIAVIAWNLAIMPENKRQPMIDQLIKVGLKGNEPLAQQKVTYGLH